MTRELLILRHGHAKTLPPEGSTRGDFDRELKSKGKRNAQRIGVWLQARDLTPDAVLSSSAERAKTTAEKACKAGGMDQDIVVLDDSLYLASWETLLKAIRATPDSVTRLMIVGHNPGLEILALMLADGGVPRTAMGQIFPPTGLAHFHFEGTWAHLDQGGATLGTLITADDLPAMFPFPGPGGAEERPRPAYYYTQSAVIPYRMGEDGLEVLIISSSSGKHWGLPKGIHDPGKTAQVSAAREAFEEAGIEGRVSDQAVGGYQYEKWEGTCEVQVFAMEVTRALSEDDWEESHRERKWMSVEDATQAIRNDGQKEMVSLLPGFLNARPS